MIGYRRQLERDLARWEAAGWVGAAGAKAIRADLAKGGLHLGLAGVLAILAAVLLAAGVMTFVAANWQELPRLGRLGLIVAVLWGAYGLAGFFFARGHDLFAHAAVLLGVAVFGAGIMLVAQMYHIGGEPPGAVLTWTGGAALAAVALRSNPAFVAAILLAGLWSLIVVSERPEVHWGYLPVWAALFAAIAVTTRWRPALHLLAMSLVVWVVLLGYLIADTPRHELIAGIGLAVMAAAWLGGPAIDRVLAVSPSALCYGLVTAFAALFAMQFIDVWGSRPDPWHAANGTPLWLLAVVALALVLGSLWLGVQRGNRALTWLAYVCFAIELVAIYFQTVGTLMSTSLFFLTVGGLVAGLAWLAWRLHRRQAAAQAA